MNKIQPVILTTPSRMSGCVSVDLFNFLSTAGLCPVRWVDRDNSGAALSTQKAIQHAIYISPDSHILFLEDDVVMAEEAPAILRSIDFPDKTGVISFCDMREIEEGSSHGLYQVSAMGSDNLGWWGNQALMLHHDIAASVAYGDWWSPDIQEFPGIRAHIAAYGDGGINCSDKRMGMVVSKTPRPWYSVYVPSLFKHVGHTSLCFPGRTMGERATRNLHPYFTRSRTKRENLTMAESHFGCRF